MKPPLLAPKLKTKLSDADRFFARVNMFTESGCWEWEGCLIRDSYGHFSVKGKAVKAHRWSYAYFNEAITKSLLVRHACDNAACVNPKHLLLGTQKQNMEDMIARGRSRHEKQTHCLRGHEFTTENTYWRSERRRTCRKCRVIHNREYRSRLNDETTITVS